MNLMVIGVAARKTPITISAHLESTGEVKAAWTKRPCERPHVNPKLPDDDFLLWANNGHPPSIAAAGFQ